MKVYIYKNGLCDPNSGTGIAKQFGNSEDLDDYVNLFCSNIDPRFMKNWRIFIANDEVGFAELDHFVLMDEHITETVGKKVEEVDVYARALTGNVELLSRDKKLAERKEKARRASIDRRAFLEANKQEYLRDLN